MAMVQMNRLEPLQDATNLLDQPTDIQRQASQDGYLFFSDLLDSTKVFNLRHKIMSICEKHGWTQCGTNYIEGLANPDLLVVEHEDPRWKDFYVEVQRLPEFHQLALDENIIRVFEILFGEKVLPHSRNICRLVFPNSSSHSTPPHQDNLYIGGSTETWTAWIPCGDCPEMLGGLAVAKGSHRQGKLADKRAVGPGGRQVEVSDDQIWVGGDYTCGDVMILHSLTVHQGCDNLSGNKLRVSCDFRYQPRSHPIRSDSLMSHMCLLNWEQIYQDWEPNNPAKYYWKDWDLEITGESYPTWDD